MKLNRHFFAGGFVCVFILAACQPVPPPEITPTPLPTAFIETQPTSTTMVTGQTEVLPTPVPSPTLVLATTKTAIPKPTATAVAQSEPILPHKVITAYVPGAKDGTGFAPVYDVVTTMTDGVTVTNQVVVPPYLLPLPPPAPLVQLPSNTINIALLGIDTRPGAGGPNNTDVIIIASINPDIPAITMLSIPRDTLAYIPGFRSYKINTAWRSGPLVFKQTILYNFGINVDYYALVNFSAVVNGVNTLDGIDVVATCPLFHIFPKDPYYFSDEANPNIVTRPYTDSFSGEVWQVGAPVPTTTINIPRAGVYTLNGLQALAFARARYGVPGGDIDRGRREQLVIRALLSKARQLGSFTKIPELYAQFEKNVQTDLSLGDMLKLASFAASMDDITIRSFYLDGGGFSGYTLPVVGSILVPNRETMQPFIQDTLNVALNQKANDGIPIEVVNGNGDEGYSTAAAYRLRELGFRVVKLEQSAQPISRTQVIDFTTTKKGSAIPKLQRTFGLKATQIVTQPQESAAPDAAKYRILIGKDFETCYYKLPQQAQPTPTPAPVPTTDPALLPTPDPAQAAPQPQPEITNTPAP